MNSATIIGRLGGDPELRYTPGGDAVCTMSVATSRAWKTQSGAKKEQTTWHRVVVWGKTGEACAEYAKKGKRVGVVGRIDHKKWEDKNGETRYTTEIVAESVEFLWDMEKNAGSEPVEESYDARTSSDGIPF